MGSYLRDNYDPDIDEPGDLTLKKAPTTFATWLLAGVALMSLVWAATSIYLSIRAEQARRPTADFLSNPEVSPRPERLRPSGLRPLFADTPASVRRKGLPASEVSLAADVRAAEERGGDALWRSHEALGAHPTTSQWSASDSLRQHVPPGREIDGWLMKVNWSILRDQEGSSKYSYTAVPPPYELTLRFPEDLAGYEVWFWGHNYDFGARKFTCPNKKFESIKKGDWVRVFGVLRPTSRIEWESTKADELLSLGEVIISDIQKADADEE
jgi:hypothetical protein